MRFHELIVERTMPKISDEERLDLIRFMISWLEGSFMFLEHARLDKWEKIAALFPHGITRPVRLMRLVTLPIEYADQKFFHLERPAPKDVGSWTSTHFGLESVHAVASERYPPNTCRLAIQAMIQPHDILMSHQSLKRALLTLTRDYHWIDPRNVNGRMVFDPYLGDADDEFHEQITYMISVMRDFKGGHLRQYEWIVRTAPVDAKNIRVYRRGDKGLFSGHDDPHNSDDFRGWYKD